MEHASSLSVFDPTGLLLYHYLSTQDLPINFHPVKANPGFCLPCVPYRFFSFQQQACYLLPINVHDNHHRQIIATCHVEPLHLALCGRVRHLLAIAGIACFLGLASWCHSRKGISPSCALAYPPSRNDSVFIGGSGQFKYSKPLCRVGVNP